MILKAELGDFLYIIIFVILMFAGVFEKMLKAKRQQQAPPSPQPYDDFEAVEGQPSPSHAAPQTLEEMMRRMMQTVEMPEQAGEKVIIQPQAQSLEELPSTGRYFHHSEEIKKRERSGRIAFTPVIPQIEENIEPTDVPEYHFDIRQAIISSEILNRKY